LSLQHVPSKHQRAAEAKHPLIDRSIAVKVNITEDELNLLKELLGPVQSHCDELRSYEECQGKKHF
jgi:hypothetical protein